VSARLDGRVKPGHDEERKWRVKPGHDEEKFQRR
jgi:hypothetical protein